MRSRNLGADGYVPLTRYGDNRPGMGVPLKASTSTTDADPGAGFFKWNNADQGSATFLYVSVTAADGTNITTALSGMVDGQRFQLTQGDDTGRWQVYRMTGSPVGATTYYKLPVARVSQTAGATDGSYLPIITGGNRAGTRAGGGIVLFDVTAGGGAAGESPVTSVNGQTGDVVLDHEDVGADAEGTAAGLIAAHEAAVDPHPQYLTEAEGDALYLSILTQTPPTGNVLLTGGGVAWLGGMDFLGQASTYTIQAVGKTAAQTPMTLSAADATDPRIDVFALDVNGDWVVIAGTPDANPEKPDVDPSTQLEVSFVYVAAGATEPVVAITHDIYRENTEWTTSRSGTTFTLASASSPITGAVSVEGTAVATGNYWQGTHPTTTIDLALSDALAFTIKSKATWPATRSLSVQFYNANTARGQAVVIRDGSQYGFTSSDTTTEQLIVIPTAHFGANGLAVNRVRFTLGGTGSTVGMWIDDVYLQAGAGEPQPVSDRMRWRGTWNAATLYATHDVVKYLRTVYVAVAGNVNSTPSSVSTVWQVAADFANVALTNQANTFTGEQHSTTVNLGLTLSGDVEIDALDGNVFEGTQTGNMTLVNPVNPADGMTFTLRITMGGAGDYTITYGDDWHFPAGNPRWPTTAGDVILIGAVYHASNTTWECSAVAPGGLYLADLADVDLTGLADGDMLVWDAGAEEWVPEAAAASVAASQVFDWSVYIVSPSDKSYTLVLKAAHGGTITETTTKSASGTCTATFKINSTNLGGTANSVSSAEQSQAHASDNVFVAGDDLVLTVSANASCADMSATIKYTRTLA